MKQKPSAQSSFGSSLLLRRALFGCLPPVFVRETVWLFFWAFVVHLPGAASDTGRVSDSAAQRRACAAPAVVNQRGCLVPCL